MQYDESAITNEYTKIPDDLIHKIRFIAIRNPQSTTGSADELFNVTLEALKLSNQRIAVTYEPETVEDQEIIDVNSVIWDAIFRTFTGP
jgi:hypothetical protein